MWKRIQGYGRDKEKPISHPVLLETTYDENQLRHIPHVSNVQSATYQPNNQVHNPAAPYDNHLSPEHERKPSEYSEASFYSQPSPKYHYDRDYASGPHDMAADISPPSSPEPDFQQQNATQPRRFRSMRDVSPVDETRGQPQQRSNIPVLRKAPLGVRDNLPPSTQKFWRGKVAPNSNVRRDEYSGEPTSGITGKAGQVNTHVISKHGLSSPTARSNSGHQPPASGPPSSMTRPTFSNRPHRISSRPSPDDLGITIPKPREPWKGASGRTEIVQPFRDQPSKQPPNFQRRVDPKSAAANARSVSTPAPTLAGTAHVAGNPSVSEAHDDPIKPVVPLKAGRNSPPRSVASPVSPHNPVTQLLESPISLGTPTQATFTDSCAHPTAHDQHTTKASNGEASWATIDTVEEFSEPSTPTNTKPPRKSVEDTPSSTISKDHGPSSRFSWTTYNTNTTYQHSPPPSPPPPLPTNTPYSNQHAAPAADSVLNRGRPIPGLDKATARKPVSISSRRPSTIMTADPSSPRAESTFSTNTQKALPRPPTELSAADHVDILEAQMEDLNVRRSNVHRLLQDLYNMAPPNPLVTNFKRMRLVEQRKKEFEDELAEIKREEHDVGLRLHRAYRKRAKEDPGSESALWIRRVTG